LAAEQESQSKLDTESELEAEQGSPSELDSELELEAEPESQSELDSESELEAELESQSDLVPEPQSDSEFDSDSYDREDFLREHIQKIHGKTLHKNNDCMGSRGFFSIFKSQGKSVPKNVKPTISKNNPNPPGATKHQIAEDVMLHKDKYKDVPSLGTYYLHEGTKKSVKFDANTSFS